MAQGKGSVYERWAKVYSIKQMAAALLYLREHGAFRLRGSCDKHRGGGGSGSQAGRGAAGHGGPPFPKPPSSWARWCSMQRRGPVFDSYKAARYSRKYLAQHEAELADYRAAKTAMSELLSGAKLPQNGRAEKAAPGAL